MLVSPLRLNRHAGADTVPVSHERHHRRRTRRICGRLTPKKRPRTPLLQPTGHLRHLRRRPMARTLQRTPVRVKPVAAPNGTVHLDDIIQHHPRSQQRSQRMPAGTVSKSTRYSRLPKSNDANSKLHTSVRRVIMVIIARRTPAEIAPEFRRQRLARDHHRWQSADRPAREGDRQSRRSPRLAELQRPQRAGGHGPPQGQNGAPTHETERQGRWKQGGGMVGRYTRGESAGSALRYL